MKFPKKLSKERLSLLSPEDRRIYEQEHARDAERIHSVFDTDHLGPLFEDVDAAYAAMEPVDETSWFDIDEDAIVEEELQRIYDEMFSDVMTEDEFFSSSEALNEAFRDADNGLTPLNESAHLNEGAEGLDCMAWLRGINLGWLGKLAMGGLAALATGIAALLIAGKDKLAMIRLKKYMNRLVEITDQGIQKKRSLLTSIMPKSWSKWRGERNIACFRSIQEMADRSMTNNVMNAAHKLGFFAPGQMMQISSGATPQPGGGLDDFRKNVLGKISIIVPEKPRKNQFDEDKYKASKGQTTTP